MLAKFKEEDFKKLYIERKVCFYKKRRQTEDCNVGIKC